MAFHSLSDFIMMGKHGAYVWSAWLIFIISIVGLIAININARKKLKQQVHHQHLKNKQANER